jgi:uncharacterized protein YfaS (alpha-2-macroglobulin family)
VAFENQFYFQSEFQFLSPDAAEELGVGRRWGPAPPPTADFLINLSPASVALAQSDTSSVSISVASQNGFTGSVDVVLTGLPSGISTNPAGTFTVTTGQNTTIVFGAYYDASVGQYSVTARGTSGSLTHSSSLSLTVQPGVAQNVSHSTYLPYGFGTAIR